jgi:hypothetical protein
MATISRPSSVKLFTGILLSPEMPLERLKTFLMRQLGPIDLQSPLIDFDYTDYYSKQMGKNLKRVFFSFERLIDPVKLCRIKVMTNGLEAYFSRRSKKTQRPVNIDPGYITGSKLVLASCKDFSHRIYLDKGVYSELTLIFHGGAFKALEWTYPDYMSAEYQKVFRDIRDKYLSQKRTIRH